MEKVEEARWRHRKETRSIEEEEEEEEDWERDVERDVERVEEGHEKD